MKYFPRWMTALLLVSGLLVGPEAVKAQGRGRGGPPPAAFEACAGKKAGDACDFECRRGHVTGTCQLRWNDELSCVPSDRGPRRGQP